jgi:hypothetical protein
LWYSKYAAVRSTIGCGPQVQPDISCCRRSTTNYCVRHTSHLVLTNEFRCTGYDIRGQNNCKHSVVVVATVRSPNLWKKIRL